MQDEQIRILCQHAVKYAPNGISAEAVADALGMRYATLMSQLSAQPGHKLGAEIVLPIMQLTGASAPMHHLARQLGGVYVELPPVSPGSHEVTASLVESVRPSSASSPRRWRKASTTASSRLRNKPASRGTARWPCPPS